MVFYFVIECLENSASDILMVPISDWAILFVSFLHTVQVKKKKK